MWLFIHSLKLVETSNGNRIVGDTQEDFQQNVKFINDELASLSN